MSDLDLFPARIRRWTRDHERALVVGYIAVLGLLLALLAPTPLQRPVLGGVEGMVDGLAARWMDRIEDGERLIAQGRFEEASAYLADLDARFPARHVKHAWDDERKRILRALAASEEALGRKRATLAALGRLVEFDQRDYASRFLFAEAARRLGEDAAALEAYESVLAIHPIQLPSLQASLQYRVDAGDFPEIAATFDRFVESLVLSRLGVALDSLETAEYVPVDGRFHDVRLPLDPLLSWSGELRIRTEGFGIEIREVAVDPVLRVGFPAAPARVFAGVEVETAAERMTEVRPGVFQVTGPNPSLVLRLPSTAREAGGVRLRLRLFKLVDEESWQLAVSGYRNSLAFDRLGEVGDRTLRCSAVEEGRAPPCDVLIWPGDL